MRRTVLMLVLAAGAWTGCRDSREEPAPPVVVAPEVLTEHRALRAGKATKQVGEDCTEHGDSACLSGVCLHVKPGRDEGYVCSQTCRSEQECPRSWRCAHVYPTPEGRLCVPPPTGQDKAPAGQ